MERAYLIPICLTGSPRFIGRDISAVEVLISFIPDSSASAVYAKLYIEDEDVMISDERFLNGTFVNEEK